MAETEIDEQAIRERAYQLWMDAGCPDGQDEQFWHQAAQEAGLATAGDPMPEDKPIPGGLG